MINNACIFCKISRGEIKTKKIYENDSFFAIPDVNPIVPGHTLIISKNHFENSLDLPVSAGNELLDAIKKISEKLIKEYHCEGFNIINNNFEAAGQIVEHVHFHIIPRKKDDGLKFLQK